MIEVDARMAAHESKNKLKRLVCTIRDFVLNSIVKAKVTKLRSMSATDVMQSTAVFRLVDW
jgi:hypothetical protein